MATCRERFPEWLETDFATHSEFWVHQARLSVPSILGMSLKSGHNPGALHGALAEVITQIPAKGLKELLCSLPSKHPLSIRTVNTEMTRDRPHRLANAHQ